MNGEGEDAGVVYCEMQGRENTAEELSAFLLARHMYPGRCGYRSNTGGKMSNLRKTCSNEKVEVASNVSISCWPAISESFQDNTSYVDHAVQM